ncbi:DoxX family protein [Desulfoluna butyratoxydans]|uniref:Doxx family n=1 Tax=Desulfoluna butyratoxydans TaxID=231438 RepID=A0A4U8YPS0_9BACT|nr:DoxX family protein [Desulfoluna butyratoxydans]VFQ45437.1 doxx family [Desulfoluna butyratoxydans]
MTIVKLIASALILIAGVAKLLGVKPLADQFKEFGLPRHAMPLIGGLEVCLAIGLQIEALTLAASALLVVTMVGAVAAHVKTRHKPTQSFPALAVLILGAVIMVGTL